MNSKSASQLDEISTLSDLDVRCGRGKGHLNHPGNVLFQKLVKENLLPYATASSKTNKSLVVALVVDHLFQRGSRFVKKNKAGKWYDIGAQLAHDKTGHAIRDMINKVKSKTGSSVGSSMDLSNCMKRGLRTFKEANASHPHSKGATKSISKGAPTQTNPSVFEPHFDTLDHTVFSLSDSPVPNIVLSSCTHSQVLNIPLSCRSNGVLASGCSAVLANFFQEIFEIPRLQDDDYVQHLLTQDIPKETHFVRADLDADEDTEVKSEDSAESLVPQDWM